MKDMKIIYGFILAVLGFLVILTFYVALIVTQIDYIGR